MANRKKTNHEKMAVMQLFGFLLLFKLRAI
jgi:hypothetical protein